MIATEPATKSYPCSLCSRMFDSKSELKVHRWHDHKEEMLIAKERATKRDNAWRKYLEPENWHPAANIMPMSSPEDFQRMVDDIRANGLRVPIVLYKDKVLDGRNRLKACEAAHKIPEFVILEGEVDAISWVLSTNMSRRHLNSSQVVAVLLDAGDLIAKLKLEAAARQAAGTNLKEEVPEGQVRDMLGSLGGVSGRYVGIGSQTRQYSTPSEWDQVRQGGLSLSALSKEIKRTRYCPMCSLFFQSEQERDDHAVKAHNMTCLICKQKLESELLLKLHLVREHEPIKGISTSSIQGYYQSDLGNMHPHGKDCGGLRGCGTVYRFSRTIHGQIEDLGFILLQQNKNDCRIVRLIAKYWNAGVGQSLLLHVLAHHQNVYALIDDLDGAEYRAMYHGLMREVYRTKIDGPAVLQIPAGFDWAKESCLQLLKDDSNIYHALVENAEELGVECNSGGKVYSAEETSKKLKKDVELAGRKLWLLRPNVQIRYEAPILRVAEEVPAADGVPSEYDAPPQPPAQAAETLSETFYVIRRKSDGKYAHLGGFISELYPADMHTEEAANRKSNRARFSWIKNNEWEWVKVQAKYELTAVAPSTPTETPETEKVTAPAAFGVEV